MIDDDGVFNPRLRTGGDYATGSTFSRGSSFNPRLRTGGDYSSRQINDTLRRFQSAPPHGRRRSSSGVVRRLSGQFQSAPPHGRRQAVPCASDRAGVSIRASAREATRELPDSLARRRVSIRASAREATRPWIRNALPKIQVSIRASAREATSARPPDRSIPKMFQSAPPHGRRRQPDHPAFHLDGVSIRASAREATVQSAETSAALVVSIRASAREATWWRSRFLPLPSRFQSAPPHGRRQGGRGVGDHPANVSIRASAREATR